MSGGRRCTWVALRDCMIIRTMTSSSITPCTLRSWQLFISSSASWTYSTLTDLTEATSWICLCTRSRWWLRYCAILPDRKEWRTWVKSVSTARRWRKWLQTSSGLTLRRRASSTAPTYALRISRRMTSGSSSELSTSTGNESVNKQQTKRNFINMIKLRI